MTPSLLASQVLNDHWDGFLPIDPMWLAERAGIYVVAEPELELDGISGDCYYDDDGLPIIRYNPCENERRRRFTIAHELGHLMLGHVQPGGRMHRDLKRDYKRYNETPKERQANDFAAQLLMPESILRLAAKAIPRLDKLAAEFNVSTESMGYRLQNIGILASERRAATW